MRSFSGHVYYGSYYRYDFFGNGNFCGPGPDVHDRSIRILPRRPSGPPRFHFI